MEIKQAEAAIEAILFAMGDSVELEKIAKAIQQDTETTRKIIGHMMDGYRKKDRGIQIMELDGAYQLCTKQESVSVSDPGGQAAEEAGPDGCGDGDAVNHCLQAADHEAGD